MGVACIRTSLIADTDLMILTHLLFFGVLDD